MRFTPRRLSGEVRMDAYSRLRPSRLSGEVRMAEQMEHGRRCPTQACNVCNSKTTDYHPKGVNTSELLREEMSNLARMDTLILIPYEPMSS